MKQIMFFTLVLFNVVVARADISVKIGLTSKSSTNILMGVVDRIKDNKCRQDIFFEGQTAESQVISLNTDKEFKLVPSAKIAVKTTLDRSILTNQIGIDPIKDTGKHETVYGYDSEIYTYSNPKGGNFLLWVANDDKNFGTIKQDLAKRDELNGMTRSGLFHLSTLPGMLIKCRPVDMPTNVSFQVIISEEPIDESIFEVPKDYRFYNPQASVNTNNVNSTTNASSAK